MNRRSFEILILLVVVSALTRLTSTPSHRPEEPINYEAMNLNVIGIGLEMSLDEVKAIHGEPSNVDGKRLEWNQNWPLVVILDDNNRVERVFGTHLSDGDSLLCRPGDSERSWVRHPGQATSETTIEEPGHCGSIFDFWSNADTLYQINFYSQANLYLELDEQKSGPPRLSSVVLTKNRLRFTPFGIIQE